MLLKTEASVRWRRRAFVVFLLLCASYGWYAWKTPFLHGGSPEGVAYGVLGTLSILVLLYFGVRKRAYRSRWGTLEGWLQCHVYLGLLAAVLVLFHTGFRFEDKVALAAFGVLLLVAASGLWGAVAYTVLPRRLTELEGDLTPEKMSEQLNQLGRTMARLASGRSAPFQKVCQGLLAETRPRAFAGWRILPGASGRAEKRAPWAAALAQVPSGEQEELRQLLVLSRQRKELEIRLVSQQRYRNLLDVWLYIHVPLSIALVVLIAAHLVAVFFYSKVF